MYINKVTIQNFRLLSNSAMEFKDKLCLMIGRNNTGKTSFMVLFEKFFSKSHFDFNDFSIELREKLLSIDESTDETELSIRLILNIVYEYGDNLCNLSEFIMDLDPEKYDINLLFECSINKKKLIDGLKSAGNIKKEKFIRKYITTYLDKNVFIFENIDDLKRDNRYKLIKKDFSSVEKLIDFDIIHAKRSVSSSEEKNGTKVLSGLTTTFFNNLNEREPGKFEDINKLIEDMDLKLSDNYGRFFDNFLKNAKDFLSMNSLKVISNLKANEIVSDSSEVVYGDETKQLPEYLNGLGHMNILYLLLNIEIKKKKFITNNKDIKLLFIEEPEAHTHPQLQYIFARKIDDLLSDLKGLQTIISTHSPHIIANHPFENIRYMLSVKNDAFYNVSIINFYKELKQKYVNEEDSFKFLTQYLSVISSELFFADKAIFIEGISESILMQYFIAKFDEKNIKSEKAKATENPDYKSDYISLSSQNTTIVQVGANAKAFNYFLELLKIPALIITDIDTTSAEESNNKIYYKSCAVKDSHVCNTSNYTIKYYLNAPDDVKSDSFKDWFSKMVNHNVESKSSQVKLAYQNEEKGYYARSFEDAFINANLETVKKNLDCLWGLKNIDEFSTNTDISKLTQNVVDKKSDFASSLLYIANAKDVCWQIPSYIVGGLEWLQTQKI